MKGVAVELGEELAADSVVRVGVVVVPVALLLLPPDDGEEELGVAVLEINKSLLNAYCTLHSTLYRYLRHKFIEGIQSSVPAQIVLDVLQSLFPVCWL